MSRDSARQPHEGAAAGSALLGEMHRAVLRYGALTALVAVGAPEQLRGGPLAVADLASRCGAHAPTLGRLLRTTASTGLLRTVAPGTYELTEAGQALLDGPELLRLRWHTDPETWNSVGELTETARTGRAPFLDRHGSTYHYLAGRPEMFFIARCVRITCIPAGVRPPHNPGTTASFTNRAPWRWRGPIQRFAWCACQPKSVCLTRPGTPFIERPV